MMAISEKKMQIVMSNYFKAECTVNTSIREAFEKGFRIGVQKGYEAKPVERTAKVEWYPHLTKLADGHCECGEDVRDDWKYCPACGARLEWNHE